MLQSLYNITSNHQKKSKHISLSQTAGVISYRISFRQSNRIAQILKLGRHLARHEIQRVDRGRQHAVRVARHALRRQLVQQTRRVGPADQRAVLDAAKVWDGVEGAVGGLAAEEDGVQEVHLEDLLRDVGVGAGLDAVDPVVRDVLADEVVAAFVVGLCAEEAGDGGEVRCVAGRAGGA
jgi:hypothetical protein